MSVDHDRDLEQLRRLPHTAEPPAELEERTVAALTRRGLIREAVSTTPRRSSRFRALAFAASLVVAAALGWLARDGDGPSAPGPPEDRFIVLLSEPRDLRTAKPIPVLVREYRDWAKALAERGHLVSGARLEREGGLRLASDGNALRRTDAEWRLATGYFVIRASSYEEAAELVADCPHLGYGGEITLRKLSNGA